MLRTNDVSEFNECSQLSCLHVSHLSHEDKLTLLLFQQPARNTEDTVIQHYEEEREGEFYAELTKRVTEFGFSLAYLSALPFSIHSDINESRHSLSSTLNP